MDTILRAATGQDLEEVMAWLKVEDRDEGAGAKGGWDSFCVAALWMTAPTASRDPNVMPTINQTCMRRSSATTPTINQRLTSRSYCSCSPSGPLPGSPK